MSVAITYILSAILNIVAKDGAIKYDINISNEIENPVLAISIEKQVNRNINIKHKGKIYLHRNDAEKVASEEVANIIEIFDRN